ncbi:GNAT family N-acetyltransferase [Propionicicella superfundia]|uniref:GNAT family N-acetyltransferase n=1 Tax=Propionicicella superfundia TaxID=348582 RepID=UPI0009FE2008|nr:GNAT family N-acetyltransferase [Propionicicella superfundia]
MSSVVTVRPTLADELDASAEVVRRAFATVAERFGLTPATCPTNAAFLSVSRLARERDRGDLHLGAYLTDGTLVGFAAVRRPDRNACEMEKLAVLPEHRHHGAGAALVAAAADAARTRGAARLTIGIIEENTVLKQWYAALGFVHTGTATFPHLPFTVGYLERAV